MPPRIGPVESLTFSTEQAAQAMGVPKRYVETLIARNEIPSFKLGRRRLILRSDVSAFLHQLRDEQMGLIARLRQAPAAPEPATAMAAAA